MFFDLCFPSIEPWGDWDELLALAAQVDGDRERLTPARSSAATTPCPLARSAGVEAAAASPRAG
jgi:hypothetical protein